MVIDISKAEMQQLIEEQLIRGVPFIFDGWVWAFRLANEAYIGGWVRCKD